MTTIDIFISYSRTDTHFVDRLEHDLQEFGYSTWVDRRKLSGSQNWHRELQASIDLARCMLVVLTPKAVASINVQNEYNYAIDEHKSMVPLRYQLGKIPLELRRFQQVDFEQNYDDALQELLKALRTLEIVLIQSSQSPVPKAVPQLITPRLVYSTPLSYPAPNAVVQSIPPRPIPTTIQHLSHKQWLWVGSIILSVTLLSLLIVKNIPNNPHFPRKAIREFSIPTPNSEPIGITTGSDGNVWFTEKSGNKIGRMTHLGTLTEFPITTPNSEPIGITTGPDGNLWFTELSGSMIGRMTPSGIFTEFPTHASSSPYEITPGSDGNLWFTELSGSKIGRMTPSGIFTEFLIGRSLYNITSGPDGNLWFTQSDNNTITSISP